MKNCECDKTGVAPVESQAAGSVSSEVYARLKGLYHWSQITPKTLLADRAKLGELIKCCMEPLDIKKQNDQNQR